MSRVGKVYNAVSQIGNFPAALPPRPAVRGTSAASERTVTTISNPTYPAQQTKDPEQLAPGL